MSRSALSDCVRLQELTGKTDMPAEMAGRRDKVLADWGEFAGNCGNLLSVVDGEEGEEAMMAGLKKDGNFASPQAN